MRDMNTEEIIRLIKESKKTTPVRAWVSGRLAGLDWGGLKYVGGSDLASCSATGAPCRSSWSASGTA